MEEQVEQVTVPEDEQVEIPVELRLLKNFEGIEEAEFWPSDITTVMNMLMQPVSFKELSELLTSANAQTVNNMERSLSQYKREYNNYLGELNKMKSVFSFDVDFI